MTEASEGSVCPLCGSPDRAVRAIGYDRMRATPHDYTYARCTSCGLVYQDPPPDPADISGFYHEGYAPHVGAAGSRKKDKWINRMAVRHYYGTDASGRSALLRPVFRALSGFVMSGTRPPRGRNRLLDVGCGAGGLLERYRDLGWDVRGIEMSAAACGTARERGLQIHNGTVHDAPFEEGAFDLVTLSHVIEHVLDPVDVLARCGRFLAPGGLIVSWTPNARSLGFAIYDSCWVHLDAPRHLTLFDPDTIRQLGRRAGLRTARVRTLSETYAFTESRHYAETQGRELPADLDARRALLRSSEERRASHKAFKKMVSPLARAACARNRGELLEAEFTRAPATE